MANSYETMGRGDPVAKPRDLGQHRHGFLIGNTLNYCICRRDDCCQGQCRIQPAFCVQIGGHIHDFARKWGDYQQAVKFFFKARKFSRFRRPLLHGDAHIRRGFTRGGGAF
jgi:hypothetical protein